MRILFTTEELEQLAAYLEQTDCPDDDEQLYDKILDAIGDSEREEE